MRLAQSWKAFGAMLVALALWAVARQVMLPGMHAPEASARIALNRLDQDLPSIVALKLTPLLGILLLLELARTLVWPFNRWTLTAERDFNRLIKFGTLTLALIQAIAAARSLDQAGWLQEDAPLGLIPTIAGALGGFFALCALAFWLNRFAPGLGFAIVLQLPDFVSWSVIPALVALGTASGLETQQWLVMAALVPCLVALTTFTQRARELAGLNERQPFELAWVCLLAENANPALYLGYKSELFTALAILFWFSVRAIRDRASSPNTAIQRSHAPVLLLSLVTLLLVGPVARIAAPSQTTPFDFTGSVLILTTIILMRFVTIRAPTAADIMRRGKSRSQAR